MRSGRGSAPAPAKFVRRRLERRRAGRTCCLQLLCSLPSVVPMSSNASTRNLVGGTTNVTGLESMSSNSFDRLARFRHRLSLPLIAAPMFLVSGVELVVAACRNGVIGSFPTVNCRTPEQLDGWLGEIESQLRQHSQQSGKPSAPVCPNLIVHRSNARLAQDMQVLLRHKPEIVITSVG